MCVCVCVGVLYEEMISFLNLRGTQLDLHTPWNLNCSFNILRIVACIQSSVQRKFIVLNAYMGREERFQTSDLSFHIEKEKRVKSKARNLSSKDKSQFRSVTPSCPTLCDPRDCSTPGFPVYHQLLDLAQTHVHQVGDAIQPSHSLSPPSPAFNLFQHPGLFQWVSSSHQVAKVLEFQLQSIYIYLRVDIYIYIYIYIYTCSVIYIIVYIYIYIWNRD